MINIHCSVIEGLGIKMYNQASYQKEHSLEVLHD
jgi:hypothetical protein